MQIIEPKTVADFEAYYRLRWEVLRAPWGKPVGSEKDEQENESIHALLLDENKNALAVCRLQLNTPEIAQLRFMGVRESGQKTGAGKKIISHLEKIAREKGAEKIILHARENAVGFYQKQGYSITEKSYLMWGEIQHYLMEKKLV
ncbi:MAG: GNAT family N-acetyltransferase [Bacteroidia bacterium]